MIVTSHIDHESSLGGGVLEDTVHDVWIVDNVEDIHHNVTNDGHRHPATPPNRWTQCNDWSIVNNSQHVEL